MNLAITPLQAAAFLLASYAVLGNDALQTLGPFLAANRGRIARPWQALFLCAVLVAVLGLGWLAGAGDPAWGRLASFELVDPLRWPDLIPPLAVLLLTQWGAPVSTSFLVLTAFTPANLPALLLHSLAGYGLALVLGLATYALVAGASRGLGKAAVAGTAVAESAVVESAVVETAVAAPVVSKLAASELTSSELTASELAAQPQSADPLRQEDGQRFWLLLQWAASGWLWSQWLIQDLANLYVYLPRRLTAPELAASLAVLCLGVCLLTAEDGGAIQQLFTSKSGSDDPRSTTLISALYGLILFVLGRWSPLPLSTTWVFLGLLGGRELALGWQRRRRGQAPWAAGLSTDLFKAGLGLAVSLVVALSVPLLKSQL